MNLINSRRGDKITCTINTDKGRPRTRKGIIKIHGKITKYRGYYFICQDEASSGNLGDEVDDKLGYKEAWYAGEGYEDDLRSWDIKIIELPNDNDNDNLRRTL